jgi:hypothetical protein
MIKKKISSIIKLLLIFIIISSCKSDRNNQKNNTKVVESISMNSIYEHQYNNKKFIDSLFDKIINYGDTLAYNEAHSIFSLSGNSDKFYYYSEIMSVKFNYPKAFYHQFITFRYNDNKELKNLALYKLLKANELGCEEVKNDIEYIFKDKEVPSSKEFLTKSDEYSDFVIPIY